MTKTVDETWRTRGGYQIVAGPLENSLGCFEYAVINTDGVHEQMHMVKCFADGHVSKRGTSMYDLVPPGTLTDVDEMEKLRDRIRELELDLGKAFFLLPGRVVTLEREKWTTIPPSAWPDRLPFNREPKSENGRE